MGFARPTGKYADQMLDPGGWPDTDEQQLLERSRKLTALLTDLTRVHETWLHEQTDISSGALWSGSGANAANSAVHQRIEIMSAQQVAILKVAAWLNTMFSTILSTKLRIFDRVTAAEVAIAALEAADLRPEVRQQRIDDIVKNANEANVADVNDAASRTRFSEFNIPDDQVKSTLDSLLRSQDSGSSTNPTTAVPGPSESSPARPEAPTASPISTIRNDQSGASEGYTPGNTDSGPKADPELIAANPMNAQSGESPVPTPPVRDSPPSPPQAPPAPVNSQSGVSPGPAPPAVSGQPTQAPSRPVTAPGNSTPSPISTGGAPSSPSTVPSIGGTQSPSTGTGGGGPQAPAATAGPGQGTGPAPVSTPQQDFQKGFSDATKAANANPMPLSQTPLGPAAPAAQPVYQQADATSPTAPAAATNPSTPVTSAPTPSAPPAPAAPTGAPPMPLGNPSTPAPAAPVSPGAGPVGPAVAPASTNQGAAGGAAAPVPISAARAERDAIANAATAGALRRRGPTPRQHARHIAAALNVGITDPSLFWITAVTSDGQILTANNYGLAYIPEHVHLPEQVRMVTADETIPAQTRGTWATYPLLAVQEWARHHDVTLQAVAGTEENLKGFDLGAARDVITAEDMPASGKMQGRNRLEVIAPEVAAKLAGISASGLTELLPPAPADNTPPADNRINLLLEVCKPLLSANPDRAGAHLKAMTAYADHLQDVALFRAHTAQDAELQRAAIAEWIYWQHISVLSTDALAAMVS